jgi:thioredoxin-dependent peroxiredoxin
MLSVSKELVMRRLSIVLALLALPAPFTPAQAALAPGAKAPDFTTQGAIAGKAFTFSLSEQLRKGPVVLYFFPAAFTPGCTLEANAFAEQSATFRKAGATIIGVAGDSIADLQRFSVKECRNKFAVAVASPSMIKVYDVALPKGVRSNRTSYVIAADGRVAYAHADSDYRGHVANTLKVVQALKAAKK